MQGAIRRWHNRNKQIFFHGNGRKNKREAVASFFEIGGVPPSDLNIIDQVAKCQVSAGCIRTS